MKNNHDSVISPRVWWLMLAVIAAAFTIWTFGELRDATSVRWQDTPGYLAHALYVAEHGGLLGFLQQAYSGQFPIAERHPLQFLMLAPFASRDESFFWYAKLMDLATGLAVLLSLAWMLRRRYGEGPALLATLLYALSNSLVVASSHVNTETQFVLCTLWCWWFLTGASDTRASESMPDRKMHWLAAGAWLGLAFLTKSPAILIGLAVIAAGLWSARLRFLAGSRVWLFLAAAALVSSPLLARNIIGHGTLFYESINAHIMWLDDWTEIGDEDSIIYYDTYGVTTIERNGLPTAADYFRSHSFGDIAGRLTTGTFDYFSRVIPGALGSALLPVGGRILGFVVLLLALLGWWAQRRTWEGVLVFFWSGAFIAFFGWNIMFPEMRYIAPLVPIWIGLAALAAWRIGVAMLGDLTAWRLQAAGICVAVAVAIGTAIASGSLTQPRPVMDVSSSHTAWIHWLNQNAKPSDRIMIGETREFHGLNWMVEPKIHIVLTPSATTLEGFLRYLSERDVRYLLMHPEYLSGGNVQLAAALEPYFSVDDLGGFSQKTPLPGWRPVYYDPNEPRHFIVYEAQ